jgi:eukaryotic-like serine/threonine-protein kinase
MPFERARDLFRGVASALDYAHAHGVVHRDLKPGNVMVDPEGRVKVMDFGIARITEEAISRHSSVGVGTVAGTPLYMSPEQEQGVSRKESDVFAMSVCLYEALTGKAPFPGSGAGMMVHKLKGEFPPASSLVAGLPPGIDEVLAKGLDPNPDKRYPGAGEMLKALEKLHGPSVKA